MKTREAEVLRRVVTDYVETCQPVGSERIAERLGVSPATVRNDMRVLIEEGYIEQPHTSAGRIPADLGYRFFVDYLVREYYSAERESLAVQDSIERIQFKLDQLLQRVSSLLSAWSDCVSFVTVAEEDKSFISRIELAEVSARGLLIIVVLSNGLVENKLVELPASVDKLPVKGIVRILNERLSGLKVGEVSPVLLAAVFGDIRLREDALYRSLKRFFEEMIFTVGRRVFLNGTASLIRYPEFSDAKRLQPVLEYLRDTSPDSELFDLPPGESGVRMVIGGENPQEELRDCSVIKTHFRFGDRTLGSIGVIGPRRMDYSRLAGLVRGISDALSGALGRFPYV
jgi:heat-inducible transcriptional repressor